MIGLIPAFVMNKSGSIFLYLSNNLLIKKNEYWW
jgi:hypothetical protein